MIKKSTAAAVDTSCLSQQQQEEEIWHILSHIHQYHHSDMAVKNGRNIDHDIIAYMQIQFVTRYSFYSCLISSYRFRFLSGRQSLKSVINLMNWNTFCKCRNELQQLLFHHNILQFHFCIVHNLYSANVDISFVL